MEVISFPALGLSFEFSKIAFKIFDIEVFWYSICIVIGIIVAIFLCYLSKEKYDVDFWSIIDITITTLIAGIIGARLYYVVFNLDYYLSDPVKIFAVRDGGLAIYGGLILGALALVFRTKKLEIKTFDVLDYIAPFVAIAQSIGRWGNFFNIEAYGAKTTSFFRMGINTYEGYIEVHPTFLYESILTFVIFCILRFLQKNRLFEGQILLLYLILYSAGRFFIEGLRQDSLMFGSFRVSQILSLVIFVISTYFYIKKSSIRSSKN